MPRQTRAARSTALRAASRPRAWISLAAFAVAALVVLAATALATSLALTLGSASNATLTERVVISSQGRTLYALSPETSRRLLCKSSQCLRVWPPLTVASSSARLRDGAGVHGRLGILRRSDGVLQVTLRGLPLYRYSQDRRRGDAKGEGIESFGGVWHAATAASGETPTAPKPTAPPASPAPPSYPEYAPAAPAPSPTPPPPSSGTTTPVQPPSAPPPPPPYVYPTY